MFDGHYHLQGLHHYGQPVAVSFLSHELHCIGHDWSLPIVLDLLKDGVKIVRTADKWRVV